MIRSKGGGTKKKEGKTQLIKHDKKQGGGGGTKKKEGKTQLIKHDKKQGGGRNKKERRKNTIDQT